jgi:hypothetical protein
MTLRFAALGALLALAPIAAGAADSVARPIFTVLPPHGDVHPGVHYRVGVPLPVWKGSISYGGNTYSFSMVGTDPSVTNATTTIAVYVIPIKMVYGVKNGHMTFDPNVDSANDVSITQNLLNSPLFNSMDWQWGATDVGTTQYVDGFQRGSFWNNVGTNTNYHVVFATPVVLGEQTITVATKAQGSVIANPFGPGNIGTMTITAFDARLQAFMRKFAQINPGVLPLFVTDNIYLTQRSGCCIGGYHSATRKGQTYSYATYVTSAGSFSQDISAFSHELAEWLDDPMVNNDSPCGILEVGDPLETLANYGDFPVTFNGVTWHPQALAFMEYFGSPANFSANNWLDNQNLLTGVCQNGS